MSTVVRRVTLCQKYVCGALFIPLFAPAPLLFLPPPLLLFFLLLVAAAVHLAQLPLALGLLLDAIAERVRDVASDHKFSMSTGSRPPAGLKPKILP